MFRFVDSIWLPTTKTPNGTETEWKYSEEMLFIGRSTDLCAAEEEEGENKVHWWKMVYANQVSERKSKHVSEWASERNVNVLMIGRLLF